MTENESRLAPKDLEALVAVVEEGSFSAAARRLSTSQSLVSARIANLEGQVGTRLFDRGARQSSLTPAGEILLPRARRILQSEEEARRALRDYLTRPQGVLGIAASSIPGTYLLPSLLGELRREQPEIRIALHLCDSEEAWNALRSDEVELACVGIVPEGEEFASQELGADEVVLVAVPAWRNRPLQELPLILREPGSGTRRAALDGLRRAGVDPGSLEVVLEARGNDAVVHFAREGIGAAFVSRLAAATDLAKGTLVELPHPPTPRVFHLLHRRGRSLSPAAHALRALAANSIVQA